MPWSTYTFSQKDLYVIISRLEYCITVFQMMLFSQKDLLF